MIHVHVRDANGFNGLDMKLYHEVLDPLREEFPDVVVDGCVVSYKGRLLGGDGACAGRWYAGHYAHQHHRQLRQ